MAAVDEFEIVDGMDDGVPPDRRRPRRRLWAAPGPWVAAAVGLAVVGAMNATPQIGLAGGGGIELGISDLPLDQPPTVLWEASLTNPQLIGVDDDRAMLQVDDADFTQDIVALDMTDGTEAWRYQMQDVTCQQTLPITCIEEPGTADASIVTIDSADGTRTRTPYPGAIGAVTAGEDLVVVEEGQADIEVLVLIEPDGTERWRVQADAADTTSVPAWVWLWVDGDHVVVDMSGVMIDLRSGEIEQRATYTIGNGEWVEIGPDGSATIHTPNGDVTLDVNDLATRYDDDAGGPVVLRQDRDGLLLAALRGTDEELWRVAGDDSCYPEARLQHRFVLSCWGATGGGRLLGVDELSGETLWEMDVSVWSIMASRDALVTVDQGLGGMLALNPATGEEWWRLPGAAYYNATSDGSDGLLVTSDSRISRLVWG